VENEGVKLRENTLLVICLAGSLAGISSLYLVSFLIEPAEMLPGDVGIEDVGKRVRLSGTVEDVRYHENGHIFFTLAGNRSGVDVVIWEDKVEQLRMSGMDLSLITEGAMLEITGDVELYRGNPQVVL
jgi:DNA/RNA endonuclease YhcR with UshA esterase domain